MRLLTLSVLALSFTVFSACSKATKTAKDQPASSSDQGPLKLTDYFRILGIDYGDSFAKVEQSFGKPLNWSDDPEYDFVDARYFENEHNVIAPFEVSKRRANEAVMSVDVTTKGKDYLARSGKRDDKRLQVLGMSRDDVLALFNTPKEQFESSGNSWLEYDVESDGRRLNLMIFCARPPETTPCEQLRVHWLGTDKL